jgi:hypothetical protein
MRRSLALLSLLFLLAVTAKGGTLKGAWHARIDDDHAGRVYLSMVREHSQHGTTFNLSELAGLSESQLRSGSDVPTKFTLVRGAGTFTFDGVVGDGEGGGRFVFTSNPSYLHELRALNVQSSETIDDEDLFSLAALDVSTQFIRDMQAAGYRGSLEDYRRFRIHGATPEYVRAMRSLGYTDLSAEDLVRFRIHGVTEGYVRDMRSLGYTSVSAEDMVRFRIHGVTPELVRTLNTLGYRNITSDQIVRFRIHGVTPQYLRDLKDLGYTPAGEDLVRMRIHGVTPEYIRELRDAGYTGIPVEKLINMRIHGIDAKWVKAANK